MTQRHVGQAGTDSFRCRYSALGANFSENTAEMILRSRVKIARPNAQIPMVTFHSKKLGMYSTISCKVEGIKPGMINPIPFSIQIPTIQNAHAKIRIEPLSSAAGKKNKPAPTTLQTMATQIHGTKPYFPWLPKKR